MFRTTFVLIALTALAACGSAAEGTPGEETSPCNAGLCLGDLSCQSDLCVDPNWQPTGTSGPGRNDESGDGPSDTATPTSPSNELDVLFVIDNSGSMGEEQLALSASIASFTDPLLEAGFSLRVAVTTTDDGNYWCRGAGVSDPESGQFVGSSCRSRLGDFYFSGDGTDMEVACTDFCEQDSVPTASPGPWLEAGSDGGLSASALTSAMQCMLPQGINGCGFESTLESARKALLLSDEANEDQSGFLRRGAHLAVVFVTDEADCSFNKTHQDTVFGEEGVGNQVFWSLPGEQVSPSSAVCWNAGVDCDFALGEEQCVSADKDVNGNSTSTSGDAALYPVARFRGQLEALRQDKLPEGADVFAFGIVGVPANYAANPLMNYVQGSDGSDISSYQARFGIGPGCSSQSAEAVPPVRIRELVEGSAWGDNGKLYSVCDTDYGPALGDIAGTIVAYTL